MKNLSADLHTHIPFKLGHSEYASYQPEDVLSAMQANKVNVLGIAGYNEDKFIDNCLKFAELTGEGFRTEADSLLLKVTDPKINSVKEREFYFPRINEWSTAEGFHLIIWGYQDKIKPDTEVRRSIDTALAKDCFVGIAHSFVDSSMRDISLPKQMLLFDLCKEYDGKIALEWNGYCIPGLRKFVDSVDKIVNRSRVNGFGDVNSELMGFNTDLSKQGINCPVYASSDLHVKIERDLAYIGRACTYAATFREIKTGKDLQGIFKSRLFNSESPIKTGYVSKDHFINAYAIPWAFEKLSKKMHTILRPNRQNY